MLRFFRLYQYVAPTLLTPLAYWLWLGWHRGDHRLVILTLSIPVLFAYVIPALGTNWLRLWEFNTRWRLGRFRPHHGFVFGPAAALIALLCLEPAPSGSEVAQVLRAALVVGSALAFWNWLYDAHAIRAGFIVVYNRPYHEGRGPEAIAADYAPVLFGSFGACYGASIRVGQLVLAGSARWDLYGWMFAVCVLAVLTIPVAAFVAQSWLRYGESGLRPYEGG